jgi:lipid II:glycine glycyltransferase (peptidoglycan interpeptide bridge formation enzyme)
MNTADLAPIKNWNTVIRRLPAAHILQTAEWAAFKHRQTGWQAEQVVIRDEHNLPIGAAHVLTRRIGPLAVMYAPKGPLLDYANPQTVERMLETLQGLAKRRRAIWLKIDPDVPIAYGEPNTPEDQPAAVGQQVVARLQARGWRFSESQVQFRNSIVIDLTRSEDELLAQMGQGKRRKVRYGPKHGVTVRTGSIDDLPLLYRLYAETGTRDGFITRPYAYYLDEWGTMLQAGLAHVLIAEVERVAVGHVILFHFGQTCWYFTGASVSDPAMRRLMPSDLLQWEAMRWAKAQGYTVYDMYGAPNDFSETDPMWGVYDFKRDFGGQVVRGIGAWDYAPIPPLYWAYTQLMPRLIGLMRRRAQGQAQRQQPIAE